MFNSLVKYKDLALKVIYYTKRRHIGSKIFFATSKFQDVLLYFEKNLKEPQTFLKSSYFLNGKQIFPNDILLYFCTVDPNLRLVEEDLFVEIEELEHIDDSSEPIYDKLLKPLINPFKLIILNVKEGILQMVDFPKDKFKNFEFDSLVNNNYACCNSPDALYISYQKNFWIIYKKNFAIEKKEMPISKEKHSMNYVLSNNTVFIAGGDNTDTFYYEINTKEFIPWGKMSGIQEKPALIQYGDFLYSFNSFNTSGIYFERTKLTSPAKKWEKLVPQSGDQESGFFYNKLYGVSKCSGGNILFAGGVNNQLRTFIYNLKLNVLYININKDESILLSERSFYKIDHNFNIGITQNIEKDHIIAIINKNSKSLNLLPFEQIGNKTRNNLLQYDNPRNRLPGNLVIQCRYMSIKDYENFIKQKEAQKKGKLNDNDGKKDSKKFGDKRNEPFKFQYRNKTPLALERISEGKSDEENDDEEFSRNKSSSAKKEKSKLDLGLKVDDVRKINLALPKKEKTENKNEKNAMKKNNNEVNNIKVKNNEIKNDKDKKEEESDKNIHSDLEPEIKNKENTSTDIKPKINKINNEKKEKEEQNKEKENKEETTKKNLSLSNNNQISKSHRLINNLKEEKTINKSKNGSKRSLNSTSNNNDGNKPSHQKEGVVKKSVNININNTKKVDINDKNENKTDNKENSSKINNNPKINLSQNSNIVKNIIQTSNCNVNNIDNVNNQQNVKTTTINITNTNEQKKSIIIEKNINNNNSQRNVQNQNQINQNKKPYSSNISLTITQKTQQNENNNVFIDNTQYQNISEKESYHLKVQSEPSINKLMTSNTKTFNTVQQKKHTILKPPATNVEENRVLTEPNINNNSNPDINQINNVKATSYKSITHRKSKGKLITNNSVEQNNVNNNTYNTYNSQKVKKTNSFQVKINNSNNQDQKKNQQSQRTKITNKSSNRQITEGNKNININLNKTQENNTTNNYNNTLIVNSTNTSGRNIKSGNSYSSTNNSDMNKEGKRYILTKNVQRVRKEDDGQRKNNNNNDGAK